MPERIIEVDREFYALLSEYLLPEERWLKDTDGRHGTILFFFNPTDGNNKRLVFVPKRKYDPATTC